MLDRTLEPFVDEILRAHRKMAFVSGPRQVGKTTLARKVAGSHGSMEYFNWDVLTDRKRFARNAYFFEEIDRTGDDVVILDEIHKYARWKSYLKGAFDGFGQELRFIVTGSGRLDLYSRGGDSLVGRYMKVPLLPFTLGEMGGRMSSPGDLESSLVDGFVAWPGAWSHCNALMTMSGFPEPLVKQQEAFAAISRGDRRNLLVREDIRDATRIREISLVEMLSHLVVDRVGSPLSINSLREDLGTSFETVRDWIEVLERFYFLFRVLPYSRSLARALRKAPKLYLHDWTEIVDDGHRFENLVAFHLYKAVQTWTALGLGELELRYVRDRSKREVDFLLVDRGRPVCLVEAKYSDTALSPHLLHFQHKLRVPAVQVVCKKGVNRKLARGGLVQWVVSAPRFLASLP
jgi:predicted AAA+ superfamily ATPase